MTNNGHKQAGHAHDHSHGSLRKENRAAMTRVLWLTGSYMFVEVLIGLYTHSLALIADAGHMLSDAGAIVLALLAIWFAAKPPTPDKTYGYYRSEILAGFFNALMLVAMSAFILYESYRRWQNPPEIIGLPVLLVALVGFAINLISLKLLRGGSQQSINVKAAYLEVMGDSLATFGVIVSSLLILWKQWYIADPLVSGLIGVAILPRTWLLLKECINILMEGTPGHISLSELRQAMLDVPGVIDVHDIHVWTITSGLDAMSAHVTIDMRAPAEAVLTQVTQIVNDQFELHHTTIQVEQVECKGQGMDACT